MLTAVIGASFASEETSAGKIVAIKKHPDGRIVSWHGRVPVFDGYPFYDITLQWKQKKYTVRFESRTGYYPEEWSKGKVVQVHRERGAFEYSREKKQFSSEK